MQLKPNVTPIGGFLFVDAPISAEPMQDYDVNVLVQNVANRRSQNPRFNLTTNPDAVKQEILSQNTARMNGLLKTPAERSAYLIDDGQPVSAPSFPQPQPPARVVVAPAVVVRAAAGVKILLDWLGEGARPVDTVLAQQRAKVCVSCPQNQQGDFFQRIEAGVAASIRKTVEIKNSMKLRTTVDHQLHTCQACDCHTPLKVWVPIKHILDHDREEIRAKLAPACWILEEAKNA